VRLYNKGNRMAEKGQYESAGKLFSRAIRVNRFFPEAYYNRAIVKSRLKDYRGAKNIQGRGPDKD
jgi:tetratricopeptide (TPR) repeat protein